MVLRLVSRARHLKENANAPIRMIDKHNNSINNNDDNDNSYDDNDHNPMRIRIRTHVCKTL